MSPHNNSPPPFSYGTSAQNRNPPATPPSSAGTPSLISALRSTPRGQLKYDRTGPAPSRLSGVTPVSFPPLEDGPSSSVIIATPTRLSSPPPLTGSTSHNCSWHSVMEEVTEEMRQVKIQTLYSITARMNQKVKNKDLKITLGKNIEVTV